MAPALLGLPALLWLASPRAAFSADPSAAGGPAGVGTALVAGPPAVTVLLAQMDPKAALAGWEKLQPKPSGPLPPPPSYFNANPGVCPATPGGTVSFTPYFAVPVFKVGWKDSPKPSIDPGPLGREMVLGETPDSSAAKEKWPQKNARSAIMPHLRLELPQACIRLFDGYCWSMSYQTLEVELDHGRVRPHKAETLPVKAQALLTILSPQASAPPASRRSLGDALRELGVQGRGQFTDLSTNPRHLDDFGK